MTKYPATLTWQASKAIGTGVDLNDLKGSSGFYEVTDPTNGPGGTGTFMVLVMKSGATGVVQKAWNKATAEESARAFDGSSWGTWGGGGTNGTAGTGSTATENGNDAYHHTSLAVATTLPAIAGGANLAIGKLLYTFPAGAIQVHASRIRLAITQSEAHITADTPDGGLGTTIGSGVQALLSGVGAAAENILTGQTFNDCNGTVEDFYTATALSIASGGDHTVYFNVADGWAAQGDAAAGLAGTVDLWWSKLPA